MLEPQSPIDLTIMSTSHVRNRRDLLKNRFNCSGQYRRKWWCVSQNALYGLGHVYNDLCAAMWFSYMMLFFQAVLDMRAAVAGTMLLLGNSLNFEFIFWIPFSVKNSFLFLIFFNRCHAMLEAFSRPKTSDIRSRASIYIFWFKFIPLQMCSLIWITL